MLLIRSSIFFEFVYVPLPNFFNLYLSRCFEKHGSMTIELSIDSYYQIGFHEYVQSLEYCGCREFKFYM